MARNDAPYNSFPELLAYINANPRAVKFGSTGPGGLPSVVTAMINSKTPIQITAVPYDGDGPALTALQGGAIDVMPAVLGAAIENIRAGRIKALAIVDDKPHPALPNIKAITDTHPAFKQYLPWGPFFGVFVKKGTPDDVVKKLVDAYAAGANNPEFLKLMESRSFVMLNLAGKPADEFLAKWQSVTSWLLQDAGVAKNAPDKFGIPKP